MSLKIKLLVFFSCLVTIGWAQQPNIVWITIEDTSPDFIGCYGNSEVKTPAIDALAKEGVLYSNAFSTNTICSPSRHTIITGVRTAEDGCGHHRSTYKIPSYVKGFASYLKQAGYFTTNNAKTDYNIDSVNAFIKQNWSMQGGNADFTKRNNKVQPFFAIYNLDETHQSRTMVNSDEWYQKNILAQLTATEIIRSEKLTVPPFYQDDTDNRKNMARLYNCIQVMDKKVGDIIQRIKDAGEWDNTIIFFYADHGQGMPRFKAHASRLGTQVPFIVRLPAKYQRLLNIPAGGTCNQLVTFEDLAPTMISIAGAGSKPAYMKGRIFLGDRMEHTDNVYWGCRDNSDEVIDAGRTVIKDDWVYARFYYPHLAVLQRYNYFEGSGIVKEMRADYTNGRLDSLQASVLQPRSAEYLFNKKNDKWETLNLANDKMYKDVLEEMRRLNKAKMKHYRDMVFVPQTVMAQIDNGGDILMTWKQTKYKYNEYAKVAEMVGMGKHFLRQQMRMLNSKDSIVRYWAVVGLRNQDKKVLHQFAINKVFVKEKSDFVKIELAELWYWLSNESVALAWLVKLMQQSNNPALIRQAAMKLANIGNIPANVIQDVKQLQVQSKAANYGDMTYPVQAALSTIVGEY